jgi:hypothetical protein
MAKAEMEIKVNVAQLEAVADAWRVLMLDMAKAAVRFMNALKELEEGDDA